jgi:hypothetical protein
LSDRLRRRYGITAEHFDRMLAEQGGLCAARTLTTGWIGS